MRKRIVILLLLLTVLSTRSYSLPIATYLNSIDTTVTLTPAVSNTCSGSDIALHLECTGPTEQLKFIVEWTSDTVLNAVTEIDSTDFDIQSETQIIVTASDTSGFYRVRIVTISGFMDTSFWQPVNIYAPTPTPNVTVDADTICFGEGAVLSINTSQNWIADQVSTVNWDTCSSNGEWGTYATANDSSFTFAIEKSLWLRATVVSICGENKTSDSVFVTVRPPFTAGIIPSAETVCYGMAPSEIIPLNNFAGGSESYTFLWQDSTSNGTYSDMTGETSNSLQPEALTADTWYRLKATDNICGNTLVSNEIHITVLGQIQEPQISLLSNDTICPNNRATFSKTNPSGGSGKPFVLDWQMKNANEEWESVTLTVAKGGFQTQPLNSTATFRLAAVDTATNCDTVYSNEVTVNVLDITRGRITDTLEVVCFNNSTNLSINTMPSGSEDSFSYSWEISNNGTDFSPLGDSTVSITTDTLQNDRWYRVKILPDFCPNNFTYSDTVHVSVLPDMIAGIPSSLSETICYGTEPSPISLSAQFAGGSGDFTYQWQDSTAEGTTYLDMTDKTSSTLQPTALIDDTWYRLKVTDNFCNVTLTTDEIHISVYDELSAPTILANNDTICTDMGIELTTTDATGGSNNFTYQWQRQNNGGEWYDTIINATDGIFASGNLGVNTAFRRIATDAVCGPVTSEPVHITVLNDFIGGTLSNTTICHGTETILQFSTQPSGFGGQYTYDWESSTDGTVFAPIAGANSAILNTGNLTDTTYYRIYVTPTQYCPTRRLAAGTAQISVRPEMIAGTISGAQNICYNSIPPAITKATPFAGGAGAASFTYQWKSSNDSISWSDHIGNANQCQPTALMQDTWFRLEATDNICSVTKITNTVKIHVYDTISPATIASNVDTVCVNQGVLFTITEDATGGAFGNNPPYQWQKKVNNSWVNTVLPFSDNQYATGDLTTSTSYRVLVMNVGGCGEKGSTPITITVLNDFNSGALVDTVICNNSTAKVRFSAKPSGFGDQFNYGWAVSSNGVTYDTILQAAGDTLLTGDLQSQRWYRVTVTPKRFCPNRHLNVGTAHISVWNTLGAGSVTGTDSVCYGDAPTTSVSLFNNFTGGSSQYSYQWYKFAAGSNTLIPISGATGINYLPGTHTADTCYQIRVSDNVCGNTLMSSNFVTIHAYDTIQAPVISVSTTPICYGTAPAFISVTNSATGGNDIFEYQWKSRRNGEDWSDINGATSPTGYLHNDTLNVDRQFIVIASTSCGSKYSNPVQITVYPKLDAGILDGDTTVCNRQNIRLYFATQPNGGGNSYTYHWDNIDNGYTTTTTEPELTINSLTSSGQYRVRILSNLGCGTDTSNNVSINVWGPFTPATFNPDYGSVCSGSSITLTAANTASGGDTNYSYTWIQSFDGTNYNTLNKKGSYSPKYQNIVQPYNYTANIAEGNVYFRVVCVNGCGIDTSEVFTVKVNPLPAIPTLNGDTTIQCSNQRNLEYWVENDSQMNYFWTIPYSNQGEFLSDNDSASILIHWYEGIAEASLGLNITNKTTWCKNSVMYSNIHIDTVNHSPNKTHIALKKGANILICEDNHPEAHYQWGMVEKATGNEELFDNSDYRYVQLPKPIDTANYDYFVEISYGKVPCATRTYYIRDERGIDWWSDGNASMKVLPNPSFGDVYYSLSEDIDNSYQINVYNAVGNLVFTQNCSNYSKDTIQKLDKSLDKGIYLISVVTSNGVLTQKIIVK